jgi:hypothetical protein
MKRTIHNQKGVSLIELVVAIPLAVLVLIILTFAVTKFITTYQETKLFVQAQEELFDAVETIRYGFAKEGITDDQALIGVFTANQVDINFAADAITIKPLDTNIGLLHKARFYLDSKGFLRADGQYGNRNFLGELVFPSGKAKLSGNNKRFTITDLYFEKLNPEADVRLLGIEVTAEVRFRNKLDNQSFAEDKQLNTREIKYTTAVYVGNSGQD